MADDMKGSVGLDVTAFKAGISELKASMNSVEASFRASAAVMGEWSNSTAGLSERISSLREKLGLQREALDRLHSAYTKVVEEQGADSKSAASLANQMYSMEKKISSAESSIKRYDKSLSEMKSESTSGKGALSKLGEGFQSLSKKSQAAGEKIKSHFSGLKSTLSTLGVAFAGFVATAGAALSFKGMIEGAQAAEKTNAQMGAVLKSTGGAAGMTAKQLDELAKAQAKNTTYSVGTTKAAENVLLTFTGIGKTVFPETIKATEDMSTAWGMTATDAAKTLGKALNDPAKGLSKLTKQGVVFTDAQKKQVVAMEKAGNTAGAQKIILQELEKEYGGSATAAGKTFSGQMQITQNTLKSVGVTIGTALMPAVQTVLPLLVSAGQKLADTITAHKADIQKAVATVAGALSKIVQFIIANLPKVISVVSQIAAKVMPVIKKIIPPIIESVKKVVSFITQHKQEVITAIAAIGATIAAAGIGAKIAQAINTAKKGIQDLSGAAKAAKIFENLFGMTPQAAAAVAIIAGVAALAAVIIRNWGPISGFFKNLWSGIKSGAQAVTDNVGKFFTSAANLVKSIWGAITGFFSGVWNGITSIFSVVASFFSGVFSAAVSGIQTVWSGITTFFSGIWNGICTVFSAVAAFFSSAFGAAVSVIKFAWSGITGFFGGIWNGICTVFSAVGSFFSGVFGTAAAGIQSAWSGITGFFSGIWKSISGVFASVGSWFGQRFSEAQSAIKTNFQPNAITSHMHSVWTGIQGVFNGVKGWFGTKFEDAKQAIFTHFSPDAVSSKFNDVWNAVQGTFSKLNPSKWGSDLVNGIANGIRSGYKAVGDAANWVAGKIRAILHFSVPDEGPLADADTYGSDFMQLIADSIDDNNKAPARATAKAAALISERLKQAKQSVLADVKSLGQEESNLWAQETNALMNSSGKKRKQLADEYEEKRYVIRQEIALRREQAVEEIEQIQRVGAMTKKELQAELEDRKQFASNVNSLLDEVKNALKEKYSEEEQAQENAINKSLDKLESWKTQSEDIINSTYDAKEQALESEATFATAALQAQLDALDKKDKADSRAETRKGYTDKISDLQSQVAYSHDVYNKAELQKQLEQEQADYQKELNSEATDDKKTSLQDQISAVKDNLDSQKKMLESQKQAELNNITAVYNAKKKSLDNTLTAVKDTYSKMQEDAQLEAEAERLIVDKNQHEIIELLNSYSDSYKLAGQTLGDKLAEGFKPAIDSIKSMIASINTEISNARAAAIDAQATADRIAAAQSSTTYSSSTTRNNSYNISISSPKQQSPTEQARQAKAAVQRMMFQYS